MKKPFAKKSFGQNFLIDQNHISKIISALDPTPNEIIIEIGAGRGALTERLVESGADVLAIELDKDLIPLLQKEFGGKENFQLIEKDALKIDFKKLTKDKGQKTKLVANLPYYISTAILQKLARQRDVFAELILMFQREVVERITAKPGNKERGFLTVLVEAFFFSEKLFDVPPTAFRPVPKVWSSVVRLKSKKETDVILHNENLFLEIISVGFRQKRKTILNNLKNAPESLYKLEKNKETLADILENLEIEPQRRAETLTLEEWIKLANYFEGKND